LAQRDDIHYGNYSLSGFHDPVAFREYFQTHTEEFTLNVTRTHSQSDPANYTVNETVSSAYLMGDYIWDAWRIIAGMRMEKTEDEFTGKEVLFAENGEYEQTINTEGGRTYADYFPGVQTVYTASNQLTLYTSWSKAVERPRYYYLAPFRRIVQRSQYISAGQSRFKTDLVPEPGSSSGLGLRRIWLSKPGIVAKRQRGYRCSEPIRGSGRTV
jgi:hypothetical protein